MGLLLSGTAEPPTPATEIEALENWCEISRRLRFRQVSYPEIQNWRKNDMGMSREYVLCGKWLQSETICVLQTFPNLKIQMIIV